MWGSQVSHFSLDIETIGTGPRAGILSIGCVHFHPDPDTLRQERIDARDEFYVNLDIEEQFNKGWCDTSDISALAWWMVQNETARTALFANYQDVVSALGSFSAWLQGLRCGAENAYLWGNGNMFDNVILRNLYKSAGQEYPVHWKNDMDLRTLRLTADSLGYPYEEPELEGTHHNALDDAKYQARVIQSLMEALK